MGKAVDMIRYIKIYTKGVKYMELVSICSFLEGQETPPP